MSEADTTKQSFLATLFSPRGRMTPRQYWVSVVISLLLPPCILLFMAMGSDPRGTDGPLLLVLPLLGVFLWLFITAMVKRLRDAGKPPWLVVVFLVAFIAVPILGLIFLWDVWPLVVLCTVGLFAVISNFKSIDRDVGASHDAG
jgi:uncharacterized membrane protein YhaH (DUF805 family)